jgi:hypothetical protein
MDSLITRSGVLEMEAMLKATCPVSALSTISLIVFDSIGVLPQYEIATPAEVISCINMCSGDMYTKWP